MRQEERYETKPLDCWPKAKELRLNLYRELAMAKKEGRLIITGGTEGFIGIPAGLGDYGFLGGETYGATIGSMPDFALECQEACESRGFARDLCAYMRSYWGSMFLNRYAFGGEFPKPDFVLQMHECDTHGKWFQQVAEYFNVPYFAADFPMGLDAKEDVEGREYIVGQLHDAILWMEKITGRKYDDEKLREAVENECESTSLWAQIFILNQAIPAPLDEKSMYSLYILAVMARHRKEVVDFYRVLRDEVEDRVKKRIAAVPTERIRLITDTNPPWYFLKIFRYLERYGAPVVASVYLSVLGNALREREDGTFVAAKTLKDQGRSLKSRDEALRVLADLWFDNVGAACLREPEVKSRLMLKLVEQWHGDGAVMHLNRGCEGFATGQMEVRLALLKAGIPVVTYEGNMADKREFDETRSLARIDAFMESLGLKKLED